jgi:hypothetical protein
MKFSNLQNQFTVRFRRWSRAGYAVFSSLACCVTIGNIAISISDNSLNKGILNSTISIFSNDLTSDSTNELLEESKIVFAIQELQLANLMEETFESVCAFGLKHIY